MAVYREVPCVRYRSHGNCTKNRNADHYGYCQRCDKYYPRAKVRSINKKKIYNQKMKGKIYD